MNFYFKNFLNISGKSKEIFGIIINKRLISTTALSIGKRNVLKLSLLGVGIGTAIGTGYSIYDLNKPHRHIINTEVNLPLLNEPPQITPSRQIRIPTDQSGLKLTLYQYQTCPFCCKVRAFLDYHGISYDVVEVDPVLRQSIKWSSYKKVPILLAKVDGGYQEFHDSSMIISALSSYLKEPDRQLRKIVKYYPQISFMDESGKTKYEIMNRYFLMLDQPENKGLDTKDVNEERKWRMWVDNVLVHTLSPNVYRTMDEALESFHWFSDVGEWDKHFPAWERYLIIYVGAFAMWMIGKRLKKKYNLKDNVRITLYDECNYFVRAINQKGTPFMGGNQPNLADLAVYGVLNSIEGCTAFQDTLHNSKIKNWYLMMKNAINLHQGSPFI